MQTKHWKPKIPVNFTKIVSKLYATLIELSVWLGFG
jgi:hypothetical protein